MGTFYNNQNVGAAFVIMGSILFFLVAGELAFKLVFSALALMCIDYGLRLMGNESLLTMVRRWVRS